MKETYNIIPAVGLVVLGYDNADTIADFIENQLQHQLGINPVIVVVDNYSTEANQKRLKTLLGGRENITLIMNPVNSGYSGGNNLGIKYLVERGVKNIAVANSDIEFNDSYLLSKLVRLIQDLPDPGFISPVMLLNGKLKKEFAAWSLPSRLSEVLNSCYLLKLLGYPLRYLWTYRIDYPSDSVISVDCLPGSFFLGTANSFAETGFLDENTFLYYEETILGQKVKAYGLKNYLALNLCFSHNHGSAIYPVFNNRERHRMLLESKIWYWKMYRNSGALFIFLLKLLEKYRLLEYRIICLFRSEQD